MAGKHNGLYTAAIHLAAPHTWPAAVLPVMLGVAVHVHFHMLVDVVKFVLTLICAVALQSAVNTFNDYHDFTSGLDTYENCPDENDAAMVYDIQNPRHALYIGIVFLFVAAICGLYLCITVSWVLVIYAAIALAAIVVYSFPRFPIWGLPLGELLSGISMGGVLTCASYHIQSGVFDPIIILYSLPAILTIGSIMLVNNTCDVNKDREGGRRTYATVVGGLWAQRTLMIIIVLCVFLCTVLLCIRNPALILFLPIIVFSMIIRPEIKAIFLQKACLKNRVLMMQGILSVHKWLIGMYCIGMFLAGL